MEQHTDKNKDADGSSFKNRSRKNDSLDDFKSPNIEPVARAASITKILNNKRTKNPCSKDSKKKERSSSSRQKNNQKDSAQCSIESSFFKAANIASKHGHTCPLCMKYFADPSVGTAHSKNCAARNNVSTKKLLAAVALQERQNNERLSIGLPAGPFVQSKDRTPRQNHNPVAKADPDLQLAIALSKSLQDRELEDEFEEALLLAAEHQGDKPFTKISNSQRRQTLKNFGFLTDKSASSGLTDRPIKFRRKKHLGPTILQTRSQEVRDRLLTERIAEILMGNEAITQPCPRPNFDEIKPVEKQTSILRSDLLNNIHCMTKRLWNSAQLSTSTTNFYVENLDIVVFLDGDCKQKKVENPVDEFHDTDNVMPQEKIWKKSSETPLEESENIRTEMSYSNSEDSNPATSITRNIADLQDIYVTDREYRNALPMDWANILNVSSMSDVVVLVKNNHIWAHKLVFHVRLSEVLLECKPINDAKFFHVRESISWTEVDFLSALAFLEFVYSGVIVNNSHIFNDNHVATGVRRLARKYRLKDLFDYLSKKKVETNINREIELRRSDLQSPTTTEIDAMETKMENRQNNLNKRNSTITTEIEDHSSSSQSVCCREVDELLATNVSLQNNIDDEPEIEVISVIDVSRAISISPDLFDETIQKSDDTGKGLKNTEESLKEMSEVSTQNNSHLDVLAQLIANEDSSSNEGSQTSNASTVKITSPTVPSVAPIHDCTTPRSRSSVDGTPKTNDRSRYQRLPKKQKSNLSLFIEKVQRINAKSALDSCTEEESLSEAADRRRFRNPFNVNNISNQSISDCDLEEKAENCEDMGKNLSVHERESESESKNYNKSENINYKSLIRSNDMDDCNSSDDTILDDTNVSMYSKYKRHHKHDNSISIYRNMLKNRNHTVAATPNVDGDDNETSLNNEKETSLNNDNDTSLNNANETSLNNDNEISLNNDAIDLTQESDTDVDMPANSPPSLCLSSPRGHVDVNKHMEEGTVQRNSLNFPDLDIFEVDEEMFAEKRSMLCSAKMPKSVVSQCNPEADQNPRQNSSIDKSKNSEAEYCNNESFQEIMNPRSSPKYPNSNGLKIHEEVFTQSLRNRNHSERRSLTPSPRRDLSHKSEPPRCKDWLDKDKTIDANLSDNLMDEFSWGVERSLNNSPEYPDPDLSKNNDEIFTQSLKNSDHVPFPSLTPSSSRKTLQPPSPIFVSSSPELSVTHSPPVQGDYSNKENSFAFEHNISAENSRHNVLDALDRLSPFSSWELSSTQPGKKRVSAQRRDDSTSSNSVRKLLSRSTSMPTSTTNRATNDSTARMPKKSSRLGVSQELTPSTNYDTMDTPELKRELEKYGIKPQTRKRARQLLNYIYNELHPVVPDGNSETEAATDCFKDHDDEEVPSKKISRINEGSDDSKSNSESPLSQKSIASEQCLIPEEMEFLDDDMPLNKLNGSISLKQAFSRLMETHKQLYNKVLTYEPLPLETLHTALREQGFKCKMNDLMDFLDEECITFQLLAHANRNRTKNLNQKKVSKTRRINPQTS